MKATHPNQIADLIFMTLASGDPGATAALYEEDAVVANDPNNPVRGRAAIATMVEEFLAGSPSFDLHNSEVVKAGDVALVTSEWTLRWAEQGGSEVSKQVVPSLIVRRQPDGHWLIAVDRPSDSAAQLAQSE